MSTEAQRASQVENWAILRLMGAKSIYNLMYSKELPAMSSISTACKAIDLAIQDIKTQQQIRKELKNERRNFSDSRA